MRGGGIDAIEQHAKLVAANPRNQIGAAQLRLQQRRDMPDRGIAGGMAMRVIDGLEAVDINKEQRGVRAMPLRLCERDRKRTDQHTTIGERHHRIGMRESLKLGTTQPQPRIFSLERRNPVNSIEREQRHPESLYPSESRHRPACGCAPKPH